MTFSKTKSDTLASVIPSPVKKLCVRKPLACCSGGRRSAMKARYGSIAVLLLASRIHSNSTAIHRAVLNG